MTNRVLAAAAVLAFTALPLAAHAQTSGVTAGATTGAVGGANVGGPIGAVVGGVGGARTSSGPGPASASMPLSSADLPTGIRKKSELGRYCHRVGFNVTTRPPSTACATTATQSSTTERCSSIRVHTGSSRSYSNFQTGRPFGPQAPKALPDGCRGKAALSQTWCRTTRRVAIISTVALLASLSVTEAMADCQIADAKLEEAILQKPELRGPANRQSVRDLRSLRDAAFTLWSYGRHADCERLLANIRELIAGPSMGSLGDNDEDEAEKQIAARDPKVQRGATQGRREEKDAKPLIRIDELAPGLRADEIIGAEVRSSDDKIVGEVRNIVFGDEGPPRLRDCGVRRVLPARKGQHRGADPLSEGLPEARQLLPSDPEAQVRTVPLMPDQDYKWLSDDVWRTRNDALFARP